MEGKEISSFNSDDGYNTLICQEDLKDEAQPTRHDWQQASMSNMIPSKHCRPAAVSLAVLACMLLMVNIGLGIHYKVLRDSQFTPGDADRISNELIKLQESYENATESTTSTRKQLSSEMSRQTQTSWEFEHQTKRTSDYKVQIEKITEALASLRSYLPMISEGCRHCPTGWHLINSVCYYFPFSANAGHKSWQKAREYCQMYGGDLAVIDSKDKENATVNHLRSLLNSAGFKEGFWIGLRDFHEEGAWKWLDGTDLVEGYWKDGEPNDINNEDCAAVYPIENLFKAWNDIQCTATMKWICEKAL